MENLLIRLLKGNPIFFLLDALHQLLCISILTGHDVGDTQVGKDNGCENFAGRTRLVQKEPIAIPQFSYCDQSGED